MKKSIQLLSITLSLTLSTACQNKKEDMKKYSIMDDEGAKPKYEWVENLNCPPGYPVEVYQGGLEGAGLTNGTSTGLRGWGASGAGSSYGKKTLPSYIDCIWVSYAERCLYSINCDIDYNKLLEVFEEGYQDSGFFFNRDGEYKKRTFNTIIVGFAPGGVCVIWAFGPGRQVEIGRYQGEKHQVAQEEIDKLDNHESLLFSSKEYDRIMNNTQIVPLAIREANSGKPIPYGLWDSYRIRYIWRPVLEVQFEGKIHDISFDMYDGEKESLFDQELLDNKFKKRAVPQGFGLGWKDIDGQGYAGIVDFNEQEITAAFKEMYNDNPDAQAEMVITVNEANNYITAMLKNGDEKIRLPKTKVDVYKTEK